MKISKLLPILCALAVGANCLTVRAEDNPAQAAARIALAKQMFEASAQQPTATNPAATKAPTPKAAAADRALPPVNSKEAKAKAKADQAAAAAKAKQEADQAAAD